jgi:hypothetical protein
LNNWYLHSVFNDLDDLLSKGHNLLNYALHFLHTILVHNLLFDHLHLLHGGYLYSHLHDFLNNLWHFFDPFDCLNDGNNLFNDSFDNLGHMLNIVNYFSGWLVGNGVNYLLDNPLNLDNDWFLDNSLHYLFDYLLNLLDSFLHLLDHNSLLPNHLHLSDLGNWMINNLFDDHRLFFLDDLLFDDLDLNDLGDLHPSFDDLLNYLGNFNHFFFDFFNLYYLLNYSVNIF